MEWDGITSWHSLVTLQTFGSFKQFASLKPFGPFDTLHVLLTFSLRISLTVPSTDLSFCAKVMNQSKITEFSWLRKAVNSIKVWLLMLLLLFLLLLSSWPRPGQVCWFPWWVHSGKCGGHKSVRDLSVSLMEACCLGFTILWGFLKTGNRRMIRLIEYFS